MQSWGDIGLSSQAKTMLMHVCVLITVQHGEISCCFLEGNVDLWEWKEISALDPIIRDTF